MDEEGCVEVAVTSTDLVTVSDDADTVAEAVYGPSMMATAFATDEVSVLWSPTDEVAVLWATPSVGVVAASTDLVTVAVSSC